MTKDTFDDSSEMFFKNDFLGKIKLSNGWHSAFMLRYTTACNEILSIKRENIEDAVKILDVGCGEKTFLNFWWNNFDSPGRPRVDYVGLEYRQDVVDKANQGKNEKSVNRFNVIQFDLNNQSLNNIGQHDKYDIILLQEILEHLDPHIVMSIIEEAKDLLSDRGVLIVSSPNPKKCDGQNFVWPENHIYEYSLDEMKRILIGFGFEIKRVNGWLGKARYFKKHLTIEEKNLYNKLKDISSGLASALMAFMKPEIAECYIFVCKKETKENLKIKEFFE